MVIYNNPRWDIPCQGDPTDNKFPLHPEREKELEMRSKRLITSFVAAFCLLGIGAVPAFADSATAFPQSPSSFTIGSSSYSGSGTVVITPSGCLINANHNFLDSGSGVDSTMQLSGGTTLHGVVTVGGVAVIVVNTCK